MVPPWWQETSTKPEAGTTRTAATSDKIGSPLLRTGLHDLVHPLWKEERPTRGGYQIDHVLSTSELLGRARVATFGPTAWSDHEPISITLDTTT